MSGGFGWRARIGQLYPSGGLADSEPQAMAPEGVLFLTTRVRYSKVGIEPGKQQLHDLESHARLLADAAVQLILFNCTSSSMVAGPATINRRIEDATGIPATTTIEAVVAALKAARIKRLGLLTPYTREMIDEEIRFLGREGFDVVMTGGTPCRTPVEQGLIPAARWVEMAEPFAAADVDGLLVSCAGIEIAPALQTIEDRLGCPVIASNQAAVWHCLGKLGLANRREGFGALLAGKFG